MENETSPVTTEQIMSILSIFSKAEAGNKV